MWQTLIPIIGKVLDAIIPDPAQAADARLKLLTLAQQGELAALAADTDLAKGQLAVNQAEAESADNFTKRWRPFIGWVCGIALAWDTIGKPVALTAAAFAGYTVPAALPTLSTDQLYGLLFGLLGLGGFRTYEKVKARA